MIPLNQLLSLFLPGSSGMTLTKLEGNTPVCKHKIKQTMRQTLDNDAMEMSHWLCCPAGPSTILPRPPPGPQSPGRPATRVRRRWPARSWTALCICVVSSSPASSRSCQGRRPCVHWASPTTSRPPAGRCCGLCRPWTDSARPDAPPCSRTRRSPQLQTNTKARWVLYAGGSQLIKNSCGHVGGSDDKILLGVHFGGVRLPGSNA